MIRKRETKLTYPPAAYPVPHLRSPILPQDQDHYGWTLEGFSIGGHMNLTPIDDSGRRHPSHLNSDLFWT